MSNLFTSFSQVSTLTEATVFPVVQNGQTRKATGLDLKNFLGSFGGGGSGLDGATGATGPQGPVGATGAGEAGATGLNGLDGATGATGPQGPAGTSVVIVGSTATNETLPFPYEGSNGDGYITQDTGNLWVYGSGTWTDVGTIVGPVGSTGATGPEGPIGATGPAGTSAAFGDLTATGTTIISPIDTPISIQTEYTGTPTNTISTWSFADGVLVFPDGTSQLTAFTGTAVVSAATTETLGTIIVGHNLSVTSEGTLSSITSIIGDVAPANPIEGDQWWDSVLGRSFTYYNGLWVETSPNVGAIGPTGATGATGPAGPEFTGSLSNTLTQNNSYTRTTGPSAVSTSTVIWTGIDDWISSAKLTIQVEANELLDSTGWHTQVCEAIIASRGNSGDPDITVYGVTHTSANPLMTFTAQRNVTTNLIEIVGTPTATVDGQAYLRIHSVEMLSRD